VVIVLVIAASMLELRHWARRVRELQRPDASNPDKNGPDVGNTGA